MTSLIRDQFTTRMKYMIPNRLSLRKATDVSVSASVECLKTEHGHVVTPSNTINVVLFGETGVGKSSVINLIARKEIAKVSSDVNGCTMQSTQYDIEFDGMKFAIFDTIGLEEPQMGVNGYLKAIEKAYELVTKLSHAGGVHLLLFCMRGGRITATTQSNYRLFCEILCSTKVPIALVFTGLEREAEMEDWWRRNKTHIEGYGIKSDGHACITAVQDDTPGEDLKYTESQKTIRDLLRKCALRNTAYSPDALSWFARLGKDMMTLIEKRMSPKRKKVLKVLVKRCKLDPETAKKIADMMEKGDPATQPTPSGIVEEVNPPNIEAPTDPGQEPEGKNEESGVESSDEEGGDGRHSGNGVVPRPLDASFLGKMMETGYQAQGENKEGESRSYADSNAAGRQKTHHANESVATPSPDDADRAGTPIFIRETARPSDSPPNPDCIVRTTPPPRGSTERLREQPAPDSAIRTFSPRSTGQSGEEPVPEAAIAASLPSIWEGISQSMEEPDLDSAGRAIPFPSAREGIRQSKERSNPDGADRAIPPTSARESIRRSKERRNPDSVDQTTSSPGAKEGIKRSKEVSNPDSADRTIPSSGFREGIKHSKEVPNPDSADRATPSPGFREGIKHSKEVPNPDSADRATPSPSVSLREAIKQSKESHVDSVPNATPYPGIGETAVQPKRAPSPDKAWSATTHREGSGFNMASKPEVASKPGSHIGASGGTGKPRNASSGAQPPNVTTATQMCAGRGDSTRQYSSRRSGPAS